MTHQSVSARTVLETIWPAVPILMALFLITMMLMLVSSHSPLAVYDALWQGAFKDSASTFNTLAFFVPLLFCATGLLITYTAGLWNIGIEGQMIMGAIGASWIALKVAGPNPNLSPLLIITLEIIVAMAAGALWAALAAVLKTRGGVHEIFGGVALNSLAIIATNYLISSPWQPPSGGSFHGTEEFAESALLPVFGNTHFSPLAFVLALIALGIVILMLRGTHWGLQLKALGKNPRAAFLLGVSSERQALYSMMFCGALAGLAGAIRVLSWFGRMPQSVSGGIGFLAILIVLLASFRPVWTFIIAFIFSALLQGGAQVHLITQLHSSLSGIIQGTLVLFTLLFGDFRRLFGSKTVEEPEVS
jgi:general nucleoside transport system permease protein